MSGIDTFVVTGTGPDAAVRMNAAALVQSGQASPRLRVGGTKGMTIDARAVVGRGLRIDGGSGIDRLLGTSGADTLTGGGGDDTLVGGPGGDLIALGSSITTRDIALITSPFDGTVVINGTLSAAQLDQADTVSGAGVDNNFIMVSRDGFGPASAMTFFISDGQNIILAYWAVVPPMTYAISGNNFGSLTAVRGAVGAGLVDNQPGPGDQLILVIANATNSAFGVHHFIDGDDNATVDAADTLRLLAIADATAQPVFGANSGFRLSADDLF